MSAGPSRPYPMLVRYWGVRGSIPAPGPGTVRYGGNTSCVEIRVGGEIIILDAGTGIRPLGLSLMKEFEGCPPHLTLLISHTHWDHIQGFPFFAPAWAPGANVTILGYDGASNRLKQTLEGQMESPYFPVSMSDMPAGIEIRELKTLEFAVGKIAVEACIMNHPGLAVGFKIRSESGTVVYIPDNEPCGVEDHESCDGVILNSKQTDFIAGADLLIIDAQYDAREYEAKMGWGHGCVRDVVELARRAGVKRLHLFHHDPAHDDDRMDELLATARDQLFRSGPGMEVSAAREGDTIFIQP